MKRNPNMAQVQGNYLFPEINLRKLQFLANNPGIELISLGIGDTTEPIAAPIAQALSHAAAQLATEKGYSGYGPEQGIHQLREQIATKIYGNKLKADEIFVSDGAKCDIGRLQMLFGNGVSIAVQDPAYPVYIEGSLIQGVRKVVYMPCVPDNEFFPDLKQVERTDLIYFCSPNNPTGAVASREQLKELVAFAKRNRSIIIFDAAYACYIRDPALPKSIFEIEGAEEVAIELGSFSKLAGFTGVRLGWTAIPAQLKYDDGYAVKADWQRLTSTIFNGASNIAQQGGYAVLEPEGLQAVEQMAQFYLKNAAIIRNSLEDLGYKVFGGINAPYLWVQFPGHKSWEVFQHFLERYHIVTTPGVGFGPAGEGFLRFTAFGKRQNVLEAAARLANRVAGLPI